jgi:hypothetical protein
MLNKAAPRKKLLLFTLISTLGIVPAFAQYQASAREDFWVCPVLEASFFSLRNPAFGGGAALGYGNGMSFGLKVLYSDDLHGVRTLEINILARFYFSELFRPKAENPEGGASGAAASGLFIQLNGGPVIVAQDSSIAMPSEKGTFSAGLSIGWRFLLGRYFFIEPAIRGGYPFIAGVGLAAGVRF